MIFGRVIASGFARLQAQGNLVILAPRFPDVRRHPLHTLHKVM